MTISKEQIEHFLHGQLEAWNARDKEKFFAHYKAVSPKGLSIDYVGEPPRDPWDILEVMWTEQNHKIDVEAKKVIINGTEAACFHFNHVIGAGFAIETIEIYSFGEGTLSVRYFITR